MSPILDNLLSQLGSVEKDHRAKRSAERAKETSGTSKECSPYCMKPNHDGHSTGDLVFYRYYYPFFFVSINPENTIRIHEKCPIFHKELGAY